jgi:hypothetical protein
MADLEALARQFGGSSVSVGPATIDADALAKQFGGTVVRQNVNAEPQKTFGGFAGNVYRDVPALYGELAHAVTNPTETVKGITKLLAGAALHTITPEGVKQIGDFFNNEESLKNAMNIASAVGGEYKKNFGSVEGAMNYAYKQPAHFLADISTLLSGGGALVSKAGTVAKLAPAVAFTGALSETPIVSKAAIAAAPVAQPIAKAGTVLQKTGDVAQTVGKYTNPLLPLGPAVSLTGKALNIPLQGAYNVVEPFLSNNPRLGGLLPESLRIPLGTEAIKLRGYLSALENDPVKVDAAIKMLQAGKTIEQVAVDLNSSGLASFANTSRYASTGVRNRYNERDMLTEANQVNRLAGATENLNALNQANLPVSNVSPNAPRRAVNQALSAEAQALENQKLARANQLTVEQQAAVDALAAQQAAVTGNVVNVSQLETGKALADANAAILKNTTETVTQPAYTAAFAASPKATIDVSNLANVAKGQLGDLLTQLKGMAPNAAALLEEYGPKTQVINMGDGATTTIPVKAKPITLEDAHKIRQAINMDRAALKGSTESAANIARLRLGQLYDEVNNSIKAGTSPEAFKLFEEANNLFKERIVNVYRTGQPANLTRQSTLNQPMLLPENIVSTALKSEGNTRDFLKIYGQDPAALQTLKTGVEDLYRQEVLKPGAGANAHATFMFNNEKQLAALDQAGMGIRSRLNTIGEDLGKVKVGEETLKEAKKALPDVIKAEFATQDEALKLLSKTLNFKNINDLRSKVIADPMAMDMTLRRLDAPAKASLARGVMQDAMSGVMSSKAGSGAAALEHLTSNKNTIMTALKAHNPKTAAKIFDDAKQMADVYRLVEETGNKLNVKPGTVNALTTAKNLDKLTQGLPEVRAVVEQIQQEIKQGADFKTLAEQGRAAGGGSIELLSNSMPANPSGFFGKEWTVANYVIRRLKGSVDNKLAVEIANELLTSESAAAMLSKAQAREAKISKIREPIKAAAKTTLNALPGAALGVTQLNPQQNQNALAR